jgi:hypothetical protein
MKDKLITYKTAKLAKEKGFNLKTFMSYDVAIGDNKIKLWYNGWDKPTARTHDYMNITVKWELHNHNSSKKSKSCSAPTQSLLQKWLRERHNINVESNWLPNIQVYRALYTPMGVKPKELTKNEVLEHMTKYVSWVNFYTYEEALEKGLQEALKLI